MLTYRLRQLANDGWDDETKAQDKGRDLLTLTQWSFRNGKRKSACIHDKQRTLGNGSVSQIDELIWRVSIQL